MSWDSDPDRATATPTQRDLLGAQPVPLAAQVACVKREIGMRERVYARWVAGGKMGQREADQELAAMRAVLETLKALQRPDPLGEALNSGDGAYRP